MNMAKCASSSRCSPTNPTLHLQSNSDIAVFDNNNEESHLIDMTDILDDVESPCRFPNPEISTEEIMGDDESIMPIIVVEKYKFSITVRTLRTLKPGMWLNDEIVNF